MKKTLFLFLSLLFCSGLGAKQQIVENFKGEFIGRSFAVEGIPQRQVNALCTDGNYLYASARDQIFAIDITDPLQPKVLSKIRVYGLVRQMVVQNGTLFASARESGCWIVDARDPEKLSLITRYDTVELATGIDVSGNVLFLGTRQNGVECVDITDVHNPVHIRMEKTGESQSVCYRDGILYSGEWGAHCITVIDSKDMSALKTVRTVNLQGYGDGVWICGNYLYVSTGHHLTNKSLSEEERHGNGHGLEIFDLSDPWKPSFVSRIGFDNAYARTNDYWTPRPCSDGKYTICADSVNGLYVVDSSDPKHPELISRVHYTSDEGKDIPVNSIAIAKGVVYAAVWNGFGLVAFECPDAYPNPREKGTEPQNASYRFPYRTAKNSHFNAWKPENGAPVRGVAAKDDVMFAACSYGGLAILRNSKKDGICKIGNGAMPFAEDVKVRGNRLYVAEGLDGLAVYEIGNDYSLTELARFKDFKKDGPLAHCLWVYVPDDNWIVASTRNGGNYYLDISDFPEIKFVTQIGEGPGWDKFSSNEADSKGMYPSTRHRKGICWVNLNGKDMKEELDNGIMPSLSDGVCRYKDDSFITVIKGKIYIYSSEEKREAIDMGDPDIKGFPMWDGGKRLSLTYRMGKQIMLLDISKENSPRVLWEEKTDGYPETPTFWMGKLAVPCGYQGLLVEK